MKKLLFIIGALFVISLGATERISNFESDIWIKKDGTISVTEKITAQSEGIQIKRGIVREFPISYRDRYGNKVNVTFNLEKVLHNGESIAYHTESRSNGTAIYIGERDRYLTPGKHLFELVYQTKWQLGFFNDFDELYWNVIGTGWRLPIDAVTAVVHLPYGVPLDEIKSIAYTGYFGQVGSDYTFSTESDGRIIFKTTKPLPPQSGFTIAVGWPKGFVNEPTWFDKLIRFARDNFYLFVIFLSLILSLLYGWYAYLKMRPKKGTIIPLFYPPHEMTPGQVKAIFNRQVDAGCLAADITNMAVHRYVTIEQKEGWFSKSYTLKKVDEGNDKTSQSIYGPIADRLFAKGNEVNLTGKSVLMQNVYNKYQRDLEKFIEPYFISIPFWMISIFIGSWVCLFIMVYMLSFISFHIPFAVLIFTVFQALMLVLFRFTYTQKGQELKEKIDGFKMYLEAAEAERIKLVGSPPLKTPELYETYLPYAMALGVEKAWSAQFAKLFAQLAQAGKPYTPYWYVGPRTFDAKAFDSSGFASSFSRSFSSTIASSSTPPGRSSGSRGGGSSGGGGGGGGGGGW